MFVAAVFFRRHHLIHHLIVIHEDVFPVCSVGSWIQGLLPRLPGDEARRPAVDVARQRRQCAERNATVNATVSHLRPGEAHSSTRALQYELLMHQFLISN